MTPPNDSSGACRPQRALPPRARKRFSQPCRFLQHLSSRVQARLFPTFAKPSTVQAGKRYLTTALHCVSAVPARRVRLAFGVQERALRRPRSVRSRSRSRPYVPHSGLRLVEIHQVCPNRSIGRDQGDLGSKRPDAAETRDRKQGRRGAWRQHTCKVVLWVLRTG